MYFKDLTSCKYHEGPYHATSWSVPLLSVGWLESPHEYNRGTADVALLEKLRGFVLLGRTTYSHLRFRGIHRCSICGGNTDDSLGVGWSQEVLIIPGERVVYATPGGIVHYIESHGYLPPPEFIDAVMRCPGYGTAEYQAALLISNAELPPPMVTADEWSAHFRRQVAEAIRKRTQNAP
jgi:hypothetical protein